MRRKRNKLLILILGILIIVTGCSTSKNNEINELKATVQSLEEELNEMDVIKEQLKYLEGQLEEKTSEIENSDEEVIEATQEDIFKAVQELIKYDSIEILEKHDNNLYMIRTKKETFADGYLLYNSISKELYLMPMYGDFVSSYKIHNENHVVFEMEGMHSESSYHSPPYIFDCRKVINNDGKNEFLRIRKVIYMPLEKEIDFGGKENHSLTDIIVTLDGIQVAFGPQDTTDANYFADYTIPPLTKTSYNKTNNQFIVEFESTIIDEQFENNELVIEKSNGYIESMELEKNDDSTLLIIQLRNYSDYKQIEYYTAKIGDTLTAPASVEFSFYNEVRKDY